MKPLSAATLLLASLLSTPNTALAALSTAADARPTLYRIDLGSGKAEPMGIIGRGDKLLGLAIEP